MARRRRDRFEARERRYQERHAGIVRPAEVAADAVMRVLRVAPEQAGTRLDRFVQGELRATSRTRSQRIVAGSAFSPDGTRLRKNHRTYAGERVILWRPAWDEGLDGAELRVVYEDDDLLAVDKPPHVAAHPTARHFRSTVTMLLAEARPKEHFTLVHRLDRETSGLLLLARTRAADRAVKIQFEERRDVLKRYLAVVWGWPDWSRHTCELPLGPDERSRYRVKVAVRPGGLASATTFELVGRRRRAEARYALVRCTLHTGRQHQIRVHLAALGLPIVGDKLYGPDESAFERGADGRLTAEDLRLLELGRHALHASELGVDHPTSGRRLHLEAPLSPDLQHFWDSLQPQDACKDGSKTGVKDGVRT